MRRRARWGSRRRAGGLLVCGATAGVIVGLVPSCLRPAEDRTVRDEAVGRAESPGLRVEVRDGLAAVRELEGGLVRLWASAPSIELELTFEPASGEAAGAPELAAELPREVELSVRNCMPEGTLTILAGEAQWSELPATLVTECRFRVVASTSPLTLRVSEPLADTPGAFHFGVLSDIQEAIDRVGDVYRRVNEETHLSFVLGAGDLTEQGSREELERFQEELEALALPYYTTLGNHELGASGVPYYDYFGRGSFSFVYRDVRFTLLDSASATIDPRVYDWLNEWLQLGLQQTHVVAMHIPPLDPTGVRNGAFASRNEATKLLGRLARGGVDLTLYGHIHSYYRFDNAGIPAHISGGGGAIPERFDALGRHFLDVRSDGRGVSGVRVVRVD